MLTMHIRVHRFGGPEVLEFEDEFVSSRLQLVDSTFLVQVECAGVNPVDTYIRAGDYSNLPALPYTPGRDFSGVIIAIAESWKSGYDHNKFKIGSRVFGCLNTSCKLAGATRGTYTRHCLASPELDYIDVLPDNTDFEAGAAATTTYFTAYRSLYTKGCCRPHQFVLIHGGSGGVGTAAIEMCRQIGATCVATAGTDAGLAICKEAGATYVLNHSTEAHLEQILDITHGEGVDLIIENRADQNLGKDLRLLKKGGRVMVVGCRGTVEISPRELMSREASIEGIMLNSAPREDMLEAHSYVTAGLRSGAFKPIIQSFPLAEAAAAHREITKPSSGGSAGRIILQTK
eukprot:GHVS01012718.1.p1 GENE.GHVS01012718.1~~GHVS01012718.1.p1  ORF type:complete len:345 (+),score=43.81 GHVS01012718.1:83-1117(+)